MARRLPQIQRFWCKVKRGGDPDSCWDWMNSKNNRGYGKAYFYGKSESAHRVAWSLYNGAIIEGLHILHKCDNPACCNPDHLFLGTRTENMQDMVNKGRSARGETNGQHKLTSENVVFIRQNRDLFTQKQLGAMFSVTQEAISKVLRGVSWSHLQQPISLTTSATVVNTAKASSETQTAETVSQN